MICDVGGTETLMRSPHLEKVVVPLRLEDVLTARIGRTIAPSEMVRTDFDLDLELVAFVVQLNS
jgi:hypothetical protein